MGMEMSTYLFSQQLVAPVEDIYSAGQIQNSTTPGAPGQAEVA